MLKSADQAVELHPLEQRSETTGQFNDPEQPSINQADLDILLTELNNLDFRDISSIVEGDDKVTCRALNFRLHAAGKNIDMSSHITLRYNILLERERRCATYMFSIIFPVLAILVGFLSYYSTNSYAIYGFIIIGVILAICAIISWSCSIYLCLHPQD